MDTLIEELELEMKLMRHTLDVVRNLKPMRRQVDQCRAMLKRHVARLQIALEDPDESETEQNVG